MLFLEEMKLASCYVEHNQTQYVILVKSYGWENNEKKKCENVLLNNKFFKCSWCLLFVFDRLL